MVSLEYCYEYRVKITGNYDELWELMGPFLTGVSWCTGVLPATTPDFPLNKQFPWKSPQMQSWLKNFPKQNVSWRFFFQNALFRALQAITSCNFPQNSHITHKSIRLTSPQRPKTSPGPQLNSFSPLQKRLSPTKPLTPVQFAPPARSPLQKYHFRQQTPWKQKLWESRNPEEKRRHTGAF